MRFTWNRLAWLFACCSLAAGDEVLLPDILPAAPRVCGTLAFKDIKESGLVSSGLFQAFWIHNDSGDTARLLKMDGSLVYPPSPQNKYKEDRITDAGQVDWDTKNGVGNLMIGASATTAASAGTWPFTSSKNPILLNRRPITLIPKPPFTPGTPSISPQKPR